MSERSDVSTPLDLGPPKTPAELGLDPDLVDEAQDILKPFEKLLPVKVVDRVIYLPENNSLWRGLQFWGLVKREISIDFGLYCIAGTCLRCKSLVRLPEMADRDAMLLCQTEVQAGTHIVKLPAGFQLRPAKKW